MAVIDTERTWEMVEKRLAATINERHRVVLGAVLRHMKLERDADLDGLIDTLSANPNYHFWIDGKDFGPKGRDGVRTYYAGLVQERMSVMEFAMDRLLVDDDCVVTEGFLKQIYPGRSPKAWDSQSRISVPTTCWCSVNWCCGPSTPTVSSRARTHITRDR